MIRANRFPSLLMIVVGSLAAPAAIAQAPQAIGVRDRANLFSRGAVTEAHDQLRKVYDQTKLQVAIETVDSIGGKTVQDQATANARALKVHGLYVLLAKKEHKIAVEPSDQAKGTFTPARCEAIVQAFADGLRSNKADEGLARAVAAIVQNAGGPATRQAKASLPKPSSADPTGVHDPAQIFTKEAAARADQSLKGLASRPGKWQAVVETVDSLDGRDIKEVLLERAKAQDVRGVYVLISRADKKFRVERSKSSADVFTQARIDAIIKVLNDSFQAGDFDEGLKSAVAEIQQAVDGKQATAPTTAAVRPAATGRPTAPGRPTFPPQPGPGSSPTPAPPSPGTPTQADRPLLPGPGDPASSSSSSPTTSRLDRQTQAPAPIPAKPAGGIPRPLIILLLAGAVLLGILMVRKLFGSGQAPQRPMFVPVGSPQANANVPPPGFGPAVGGQPIGGVPPGYPPPPPGGYPPGYAPPGGGMGGFVKGVLGGAAGAVVGNMIYDQFGRPRHAQASEFHPNNPTHPLAPGQSPPASSDGHHAENAAVGGWGDAPAPPSDEWGGNTGGAEGGWGDPNANQEGGDWGSPEPAGGQGDWGGDPGGGGGGDWGGNSNDGGGGGDWGGGGGGDDPANGGW